MADARISDLPPSTTPYDPTDLLPFVQDVGTEAEQTNKANFGQFQTQLAKLTTKGDLLGFGTEFTRVPVGANGKVLTANSGAAAGFSWEDSDGDGLWSVIATSYLTPLQGNGYKGVRFYNDGETQYTRISYESNGIYYDSSDTAAIHRFWQTIQAETNIKLNTTGALTTNKGINLTSDSANIMLGADDGSIRSNINDTAKSHIWSVGPIGSATTNAALSGLGQFRVYNAFGPGSASWAGIFGTTTGDDPVVVGWNNESATIAAVADANLTTLRDLVIGADNLTLGASYLYAPAGEFDGNIFVAGTLQATNTVTGVGDTAAFLGKASSNANRQLSIGFNPSLDIAKITATKVGTGIMGLELYGNHLYMEATGTSHMEITSSYIDLTSTTTQVTSSAEGIKSSSTGIWRGGVFWGNGGTNNVCLGNLSGVSCIGGNNSNFSAWTPLYIYPSGVANVGIGLNFPTQTANAQLHVGTSTILGCPTSALADASHYASQVSFWVNEGSNQLTFKVKYSDGTTVKSGTVSLA